MKKNEVIDVLRYENFLLKTKYNEIVEHYTKLQDELKTVKENYSKDYSQPQFRIISFLQEKNAKLNKELNEKTKELKEKNNEITKIINEPFVLLDAEPIKSQQPLFHISKYKICPSTIKYENDIMSEITQE